LSLAVVRDLRDARAPAGPDELAAFETDVLAGFVLARAAAGLSDNTIRSDVLHLEQLRKRCGSAWPTTSCPPLNGSILGFADQNGKSWALIGGVGKLIELTGYKQSAGLAGVAASRSRRLKTAPDDGAELVRSPAGHRVGGPAGPSPLAGRESGCAVAM
jgi:hypothetical protein